jgi:large subunit ribosomal protein L30
MAKVIIRQVRSTINRPQNQKRTIIALGLGKINKSVEHEATPAIEGMIRTVNHLVEVKKV